MLKALPVDVAENLSVADFQTRYFDTQKPVVIRGGASHWPAMQRWQPAYLKEKLAGRTVQLFGSKDGIHFDKKVTPFVKATQYTLPVEAFVDRTFGLAESDMVYYLRQQAISNFSELTGDIDAPKFANRRISETCLWIGGTGNITNTHYDMNDNFLVQVSGRKRLMLFSSEQFDELYPMAATTPNTSNYASVDIANPDLAAYPAFAKAQPFEAFLEPGDMLFIPVFWWHWVQTLEAGCSVNFWWCQNGGRMWRRQMFHYMPRVFRDRYLMRYASALIPH